MYPNSIFILPYTVKDSRERLLCFFTQPQIFSVELFIRLDISLLKEAATAKIFR